MLLFYYISKSKNASNRKGALFYVTVDVGFRITFFPPQNYLLVFFVLMYDIVWLFSGNKIGFIFF